MAKVHGSGDAGPAGGNPKVRSTFDRYHGQPHTPDKVKFPGGVVTQSGEKVQGHTVDGAKYPTKTSIKVGHQ